MSAATIACRQCGASSARGDGFQLIQPYKACGVGFIDDVAEDGSLVVGWVDRGNPDRLMTPEIVCGACGHQWATTRSVHMDLEAP